MHRRKMSTKATNFLHHKPPHVGTVGGHRFFANPNGGGEDALIMVTPDGQKRLSKWGNKLPTLKGLNEEI